MSAIALIAQVTTVHLLASLSPGPDIFLTLRNAIAFGPRHGVCTAAGIVAGVVIQVSLCLLGLSALIASAPAVSTIILAGGGAYLVYLGFQSIAQFLKPQGAAAGACELDAARPPLQSAFKQGLLTNLLNVKALLYFIALFTYVIRPEIPLSTRLSAALVMIASQMVAFSLVARLAGSGSFRQWLGRFQKYIVLLMGVLLLVLGIVILFQAFRSL